MLKEYCNISVADIVGRIETHRIKATELAETALHLSDILTTPASPAGIPTISASCVRISNGRPIGLQITGPAFSEEGLFIVNRQAEKLAGYDHAGN
jgi:aspartyl-tRNA(Asn)/glutamyl-tRNA(Gln) amidotransferase subunit A